MSAANLLRRQWAEKVSGGRIEIGAMTRAISGNLCRCTGYQGIVLAALDAAKRMRQTKAVSG
jgi:aerobic-type carbon monoxide dehydrogenase small subunit (CoxS/CutS family)